MTIKYEEENIMKKLLSLILVMCMALTAFSSLAEGDLTGTWYLNSLGMCAASIEINADGTCAVTASTENGEERQEGTWTLDGDNPVLTVGEQNLPMTWDGETLSLDMQAILALVPDTAGMDLSSLDPSILNSFFQISREPEKISAADFAAYQVNGTLPEGVTEEEMQSVVINVMGSMFSLMGSMSADTDSDQVLTDAVAVLEENFIVFDNYDSQAGTFLGKVQNITDAPVWLNNLAITLKDADGNEVGKNDYASVIGSSYLDPGEETYVSITAEITAGAAVAEHELSIEAYAINSWYTPDTGIDVSDIELRPSSFSGYTAAGKISNAGETVLSNIRIVFAVRDAEGKLLDVISSGLYGAELPAGSSIILLSDMNYSIVEYCSANNIAPASVESLATTETVN